MSGGGTASTSDDRELALLRLLADLDGALQPVRRTDKAFKVAVRRTREHLGGDAAGVVVLRPGADGVEPRYLTPRGADLGTTLLAGFARGGRPRLPPDLLVAPLERRGRRWGLLVVRRPGRPFDREDLRELRRIAVAVSRHVRQMDRLRLSEVRARIDRKVMEQLRPNDLFYQILHGLRSLTRYDHSAALLIHEDGPEALRVVAEQIAWRKARSARIGQVVPLDDELEAFLESGMVYGFDRTADGWAEWSERAPAELAAVLEDGGTGAGGVAEGCMLVAPFSAGEQALGVLKIAGTHPGVLGADEAELVRRFLPQAAIAIRTLQRTVALEEGVLEAEKKHAMANLARGVSHDVNNALGSVLPLVQQLLAEAREGRVDAAQLERDLESIEQSLQVCRRIFGGMLAFARGATNVLGRGDVARAVQSTLAILAEGMRRHGIALVVELPERLPAVRGAQGDLEQLVLNLATNARDAMPRGGTLTVRARRDDDVLELSIGDTGPGIAPEELARIQEPFYSTKRHGHGLGLSVCRSIVWALRGRMSFETGPGQGTTVILRLPLAAGGGAAP